MIRYLPYSLNFLLLVATHSTPPTTTNIPNDTSSTEGYEFGAEHLEEDLRNIAYYLRQHKFNEYDRRYITDELEGKNSRSYFALFPKPPLRSLHWEVLKYCEPSFFECVAYLTKRIKNTALKRNDDTSVVIEDQKWFNKLNLSFTQQIIQTDNECKKLWAIAEERSDPFEGPIERFKWRVTASYFMCMYTMNGTKYLKHLREPSCDNHANCLNPNFGAHNRDVRADDEVPFNCAKYSFCPDLCCPFYHIKRYEDCWGAKGNPCTPESKPGSQQCFMNMSDNTDFRDITMNRWNVSCKCGKNGFKWSSFYGICVDVDECENMDPPPCNIKSEACVNLAGSFKCACRWGYSWNEESKQCEYDTVLDDLVYKKSTELDNTTVSGNKTEWFEKIYRKVSGYMHKFG